jgi:hypothetical protein
MTSWQEEAAIGRRVNAELLLRDRMITATVIKGESLILTDGHGEQLKIPREECTPHVVANILNMADFGDYDRLLRLVEDNMRLTFTRDDSGVTYIATGRTV